MLYRFINLRNQLGIAFAMICEHVISIGYQLQIILAYKITWIWTVPL